MQKSFNALFLKEKMSRTFGTSLVNGRDWQDYMDGEHLKLLY